jgi:hypothetical protein
VLAALEDADEGVREEVIDAWERRPPAPSAIQAFARALVAFEPWAKASRERRAVAEGAGSLGADAVLARLSGDPDVTVRLVALGARAARGSLPEQERREALTHEDPWIRSAVLDLASAQVACEGDADLSVRRSALALLAARAERLSAEERRRVGFASARAPDPWMRARGAELLHAEGTREELEALLRLSFDVAPMVRSAAAAVLEACETLDSLVGELLRGAARAEDSEVRASAYTWLLRRADASAFEHLCAAL